MKEIADVVVVTGAGKGIGRSIAHAYAGYGAKVIIAEKDPEHGRKTETDIVTAGNSAFFIQCDVSHPENVEQLFGKISDLFGSVDILINNAGISKWKSPYILSVEEWDEIINTNLRGVFLCSR